MPAGSRPTLLQRTKWADLARAVGFVLLGGLGVNLVWIVSDFIHLVGRTSWGEGIRQLAADAYMGASVTFPAMPLAAIIVYLAPPRGAARALACMMSYLWLVAWCWYIDPGAVTSRSSALQITQWIAAALEGSAPAALLVWALAFKRTASTEADVLARAQIQAASLESELQRARLQLLRAQIEPHFLFNTLANIRTLARIDPRAAIDLIDHFMRYLSAALPRFRQEEAPLADEMSLIEAYLNIFRVRMGRRLAYEIAVPSDLGELRIPTMMVLTLVENALKHGINPVTEGGFIRISVARQACDVLITVADSGRGMQAQYGYGTGLANLHLRLTGRFGSAAQLTLAHAQPRGVIATLRLPSVLNMAAG